MAYRFLWSIASANVDDGDFVLYHVKATAVLDHQKSQAERAYGGPIARRHVKASNSEELKSKTQFIKLRMAQSTMQQD